MDSAANATEASELPESLGAQLLYAKMSERLLGEAHPTRVGRFTLETRVGEGGIGSVWLARDDELHRQVAIKFLRSSISGPEAQQRLQREAQALAQLSHPNVVSVYDVGRHGERVWIAMEFVPGRSLRQWAEAARRSQAEIMRHWLAAGRGLAALHSAGLIHRDVKPDNIVLGDDGRVRVIDLGLVRADAGGGRRSGEEDGGGAGQLDTETPLGQTLTVPAGFLGTPAYAAPEQRAGAEVDARSDIYAYCLSVWEALSGERPGPGAHELKQQLSSPAGLRIPRRIRRVLARGMSAAPEDRYPDMPSLLAALTPRRGRQVAVAIIAVAGVAAGGGFYLGDQTGAEIVEDPCAHASEAIDALWDPPQRATVERALSAIEIEAAIEILDGWTQRWRDATRRSCEDFHRRRISSPDALDRRQICLDRRLEEFAALIESIGRGELSEVHELLAWLAQLEEPSTCTDQATLASTPDPPALGDEAEVARIRRALISARVGSEPERLVDRLAVVKAERERALTVGWVPLIGQAELALGELHALAGEASPARVHIGRALDIGEGIHDVPLLVDAWSALNEVERILEFDAERTHWALERRMSLFEYFEPSPRQRARALTHLGQWHQMEGRDADAEQNLEQAVAMFESAGPTASWEAATVLRALAIHMVHTGRSDEAERLFERAGTIDRGVTLGAQVVQITSSRATPTYQAGLVAFFDGDLDGAQRTLEQAMVLATQEQGTRGEMAARIHIALAAVADARGDLAALRHHAEQADVGVVDNRGPTHPERTDSLSALGTAAYRDGRYDAAVGIFERALTIVASSARAESIEVADAEINLADALLASGRLHRAAALCRRGLATLSARLPADDPGLALALAVLGRVQLEEGDPSSARESLARALSVHGDQGPDERISILRALASAEAALGGGTQARAYAQEARDIAAGLGRGREHLVEEITGWLREHP